MKPKNRSQIISYIILIMVAALAGIFTRTYPENLPPFVVRYSGDTMWATALYFLIALLSLKKKFGFRFYLTLAISLLVEFSQLYRAPWIDGIRETTIGALILGNGFLWTDLLCYLAGAILALIIDYSFIRTRS